MSAWDNVKEGLADVSVTLGRALSNAYVSDPKMLGFILARYKFCAKLLQGQSSVVEIGCGEAFGAPIVAQGVRLLLCTDTDAKQLEDNEIRAVRPLHLLFKEHDFCKEPLERKMDAAFSIDVLEHIEKKDEENFLHNTALSLRDPGICIVGTPNATAAQYASKWSQVGHVNLKTHDELKALMRRYFRTVFMFSMNDEVVHTGYAPMSHYLWAVGVGV